MANSKSECIHISPCLRDSELYYLPISFLFDFCHFRSYKELLPLIPSVLNGLFRIFTLTEDDALRLVIVELSLTIPARLSVLLPHLPLLMKLGLIPALQSNHGDLNNLG